MEYLNSLLIILTLGSILGDVVAVGSLEDEELNAEYASVKVMIDFYVYKNCGRIGHINKDCDWTEEIVPLKQEA